jgi:hypothetical protein
MAAPPARTDRASEPTVMAAPPARTDRASEPTVMAAPPARTDRASEPTIMAAPPARHSVADGRASEPTVMAAPPVRHSFDPHRASEPTMMADHAEIDRTDPDAVVTGDDAFFDEETIQRSGANREVIANQGALPTQFRAPRDAKRSPTTTTRASRRKPKKRIFMLGSMFALAMLSFSIVLCVKTPSKSSSKDVPKDAGLDASFVAIVEPDAAVTPDASSEASVDAGIKTTILKVNTRPPGGTVKVGDQTRTAPAQFALPAGKHVVAIELAGWQAERREVDLPDGVDTVLEMAFSKRQRPLPAKQLGKLSVRTNPWSDVYIGTRKLGQSPFADMEMPAGTYTLLFKHPTHEVVRKTVTITPNKTTKLNFSL